MGHFTSTTFALDAEGRIVAWNGAIEELTGASAAEAVGHEHASEMFYPDGRRAKTLADKVLDNPRSTHEQHDVELDDPETYRVGDSSTTCWMGPPSVRATASRSTGASFTR